MSTRTPNQEKALAWYCEEHNLMPQLSTHPTYYFVDKSTGEKSEKNIHSILREWEDWRSADKEQRKQERKDSKRNANQQTGRRYGA